jgi:uncharacterized protein YjbI with pentapeptide repeats
VPIAKRISHKELRERAIGAISKSLQCVANNWILILGILLIFVLLVIGSIWNWDYWSELTYDQSHSIKEIKTDRTRIIQQILLIVGGVAAFILAGWRTWTAHTQARAALAQVQVALRQADLAERAHNIDRYTRGANMLDSDKIAVRQAGVYTLLEIGRADTANFYNLVIRLLAGFARVRSAEFTKQQMEKEHLKERRRHIYTEEPVIESDESVEFSDLHEALSSIGWLREQRPDEVEAERTAKFVLNLSGIVGVRRSFTEVDFSLANLRGADFTGSYFHLATFGRADLRYATFHGVNATSSNFAQAWFQNTDLELAVFDSCNFEGVSFASAELKASRFQKCNISGTRFESAASLKDEMLRDAWAWKDRPPKLPPGVAFNNYFDPGLKGEFRDAYRQMTSNRGEFGPPE